MNIRTGIWLAALLLPACVTINVYFPAAAAERAADRIIDEVYGESPNKKAAPPTQQTPQPGAQIRLDADRLLAFFIKDAVAAEPDLNVSTPVVTALTDSLSARNSQLAALYISGAIGIGADGLLVVRDLNAIPLKDRNAAKQLVADDNKDREALYREIANANSHPEWEAEIRGTFAKRWVEKAPAGYWYQTGGAWKQK